MKMYYLKTTEEMGRGLYAAYDLKSDVLLFTAELLVLNEQDTVKVNETELCAYTFVYDASRDCIVLGDGEIFNHSETPNVAYKIIDYDGRKVMAFYTLVPIKSDEQLFIDYGADTAINLDTYKVNLY